MDLMKTLLIYMSATMALAVNSTAAPKETPVPTPVESAIVETVETQVQDSSGTLPAAAVTNAATPTAQITPAPVPTITPNVKGYHNLTMGTKGKEVKKLQEKLIEKGYLPDGSADGAYGRQTYNAVKKFQYYNGLKADGIAGRATQTNLFENPDIVDNPEKTEEAATDAPAESTPAPAETAKPETAETDAGETEAPETALPATEVPVTEVPVTEAPATEAPVTEAPATEVPVTEAPATEVPVTEVPVTEAPITEAPATEEPENTEKPEEETKQPSENVPEDVEEIDLDAEDAENYEAVNALVALNEADGPLEFIATEDGVPVTARPRVSQCKDKIRISLDDLCKCVEGWRLTDDGVGTVVMEAAGYTLALYDDSQGCTATVNGTQIAMAEDDYDFVSDGHFIDARFLASALKGEAVWDQEENTLMLRIRDKDAVQYAD